MCAARRHEAAPCTAAVTPTKAATGGGESLTPNEGRLEGGRPRLALSDPLLGDPEAMRLIPLACMHTPEYMHTRPNKIELEVPHELGIRKLIGRPSIPSRPDSLQCVAVVRERRRGEVA